MTHNQAQTPVSPWRILIALALLGLCIWFIWSNSLQPPEVSARRSEAVAAYVTAILSRLFGRQSGIVAFAYTYIRKIAHAVEFALLGATSVAMLAVLGRVKGSTIVYTAFMVLLVAVADETIQMFTGRGSSVADIVLDFAGGLAGLFIALLIFALLRGLFRRMRA